MVKTGRERGPKTNSDLHKFIYILIHVNIYLPGMHTHSSKNKKREILSDVGLDLICILS